MIAFSGHTRVAANRPCMIPARASAAVELYTATRTNLIPKNVAAATCTHPTMRYVVTSARAFITPNLQLAIHPTTLQLAIRPTTYLTNPDLTTRHGVTNEQPVDDDFLVCRSAIEHT